MAISTSGSSDLPEAWDTGRLGHPQINNSAVVMLVSQTKQYKDTMSLKTTAGFDQEPRRRSLSSSSARSRPRIPLLFLAQTTFAHRVHLPLLPHAALRSWAPRRPMTRWDGATRKCCDTSWRFAKIAVRPGPDYPNNSTLHYNSPTAFHHFHFTKQRVPRSPTRSGREHMGKSGGHRTNCIFTSKHHKNNPLLQTTKKNKKKKKKKRKKHVMTGAHKTDYIGWV
ncbi:hypothetical protein IWZ00DRAFT_361017 [Phyllosticta capitalensis]|uniref:uncharacterized protein n=1 Tax=Phyllosticta capitalensis TaxID=121624 RepID=UPI0031308A63